MDVIMVSEPQALGQCWAFPPDVEHVFGQKMQHVRGRVKSPTLPMYAWVVGFISLEQTSSFKVPFGNE
jgi:hypothetical protein